MTEEQAQRLSRKGYEAAQASFRRGVPWAGRMIVGIDEYLDERGHYVRVLFRGKSTTLYKVEEEAKK